jgi:hypothetical protein
MNHRNFQRSLKLGIRKDPHPPSTNAHYSKKNVSFRGRYDLECNFYTIRLWSCVSFCFSSSENSIENINFLVKFQNYLLPMERATRTFFQGPKYSFLKKIDLRDLDAQSARDKGWHPVPATL